MKTTGVRAGRVDRVGFRLLVVLCLLCIPASTCVLGAQSGGRGDAVYQALRSHGVLEDYLADLVRETATRLVKSSGDWSRAQVNGGYLYDAVNVYLVDGSRLPTGNILREHDIDLTTRRFSYAMVDEASRIIFVDTRFLKEFVAYRMLVDSGEDPLQAAAYVRVNGFRSLRELWDPAVSRRLESRGYRDLWLIAFRGMLAFVIGHEMGHMSIGRRTIDFDDPFLFENKEERDFRWACPELTDSSHRQKQEIEKRADDYAVALISRVLFPDNIEPRRLLYELGAHQYLFYQLKNEQLNATLVTGSENIHWIMRRQLGDRLYSALVGPRGRGDRGAIHVLYPRSHPSTLLRVTGSLENLTRSPVSVFYHDDFGFDDELDLLNQLVAAECTRLRSKYGSPW